MKLLLLNPNTSAGVTTRIERAARDAANPQTSLVTATASKGMPYIATRAEAVIAGAHVLEMLAERHQEVDAAIIAAFGDPGLNAARELFSIPIIGLAEAGMLTACMSGGSFAVVTFSEALNPWYYECIAGHGLRSRCTGVRALNENFHSVSDVQDEKEQRVIELANAVIHQDGADVIVLAGAPLAGLARKIRDQIPVPVVDCVEAAVKLAEAIVALDMRKASAGSFRRPAPKSSIGLHPALAGWLGHY